MTSWPNSRYYLALIILIYSIKPLREVSKQFLIPFIDKSDWFWKFLTIAALVASFPLILDIGRRFLVNGVTPEGVIGVIIPSVLTFFVGKDTFGQITNGYGLIEKFLKKFPFIPSILTQECACILSVFIFVVMVCWHNNLDRFSECYYNRAVFLHSEIQKNGKNTNGDKLENVTLCRVTFLVSGTGSDPSEKGAHTLHELERFSKYISKKPPDSSISKVEADLNRAISINPDNAKAHSHLGWIYELRQDLKQAEIQYALGMQSGSLEARSRLAGLYLNNTRRASSAIDEKFKQHIFENATKAANVLRQEIEDGKMDFNESDDDEQISDKRSWQTMMAWAKLEQGLLRDSLVSIQKAMELNYSFKNIEKQTEDTPIFCIYAELLDNPRIENLYNISIDDESNLNYLYGKNRDKKNDEKLKQLKPVKRALEKCKERAQVGGLDNDYWTIRLNEKFEPKQKR